MLLRTLGGLGLMPELDGARKPLLLLAYLAVEGRRDRRTLARLLWPHASNPQASLSVALSTLRKAVGGHLVVERTHVATTLAADATLLLRALDRGEALAASERYAGEFLGDIDLNDCSAEFEDWVLATRENISGRVRAALLRHAELATAGGDFGAGAQLARQAWQATGASTAEPEDIVRLHRLLLAAGAAGTEPLRREATEFGLVVARTRAEARAQLARIAMRSPVPVLPADRLLGRDRELARLRGLLARGDCRLVTVVGPGGIGKTSLALWFAAELRNREDVAVIPLDPVTEPRLVPAAILQQLGLRARPQAEPWDELARLLSRRRLLLVIDNFEHLPAAAPHLGRLLEACPELRLLVTSREPLGLPGQHTVALAGLEAPPDEAPAGDAAGYPAVQLFIRQARRSRPDFAASPGALADIARLARMVEGSPLALTLAAAWMRMLPPAAIAEQIGVDGDFLQGTPGRHGSMRAVFETSWRLLDSAERQLLRRLAVFRGGFTADGAAEVAGATPQLLARLVDRSLLQRHEDGRFDRHPLLHSFMAEQLAHDPSEAAMCRRAHAEYHFGLLRQVQAATAQGGELDTGRLESDLGNLRVAWNWVVENSETRMLSGGTRTFAVFMDRSARAREGADMFRLAIAAAAPGELLTQLNLSLAWLLLRLGSLQEAAAIVEREHEPVERADAETHAWGLTVAAMTTYRAGDRAAAEMAFRRLLGFEGARQSLPGLAAAHGQLAVVLQAAGDYAGARQQYEAALSLSRGLSDWSMLVNQLQNLAALEMNSDNPAVAEELLHEALQLARAAGNRQIVPVLLHNLANLASKRADHEQALATAHEALELVRDSGEQTLETGMLATLSWIELRAGNAPAAERHARASLEIARLIADKPAALTAVLRYAELELGTGRGDAADLLAMVASGSQAHAWASRRARALLDDAAGNLSAPVADRPGELALVLEWLDGSR